jgi:hypothetical protein
MDIIWSDFDDSIKSYEENFDRGCGFLLGVEATQNFLRKCHFTVVVRAHQSEDMGFNWVFGASGGCLTVFSACDYTGMGNNGAYAVRDGEGRIKVEILSFLAIRNAWNCRIIWPEWILEQQRTVISPSTDVGRLTCEFTQEITI